jgi:hypothetical protein
MRYGMGIAVLAGLLLSWSPQAAAQDEEDIRWIDATGAASGCIGSPKTAACAVETALACRVRREAALCGTVGLTLPPEEELPFSRRNPDPFTVVDVTGVKYLLHDEEAGDNRRVGVSIRFYGRDGLNWPDDGWRRLVYGVRREGSAWRVEDVSWQAWIRMIGPRDATSRCIGDRRTPVCAVETHIVCRLRDESGLCADSGGLEPKHFRPKGATVLYYIDRIRKWDPPEHSPPGGMPVVVWVAESTDLPPPGAKQPDGAYIARPAFVSVSYILERREGEWRVANRTERP